MQIIYITKNSKMKKYHQAAGFQHKHSAILPQTEVRVKL